MLTEHSQGTQKSSSGWQISRYLNYHASGSYGTYQATLRYQVFTTTQFALRHPDLGKPKHLRLLSFQAAAISDSFRHIAIILRTRNALPPLFRSSFGLMKHGLGWWFSWVQERLRVRDSDLWARLRGFRYLAYRQSKYSYAPDNLWGAVCKLSYGQMSTFSCFYVCMSGHVVQVWPLRTLA